MSRRLRFVVIGAQKAGTTTLFQHLRHHPGLWLPPEKEAPFFSRDEAYAKGQDWYFDHFFGRAPADRAWGTASPDYMSNPATAARLHEHNPELRLVALLRDPIRRALSHHAMIRGRGVDDRTASEALAAQLDPEALARRDEALPERDAYVANGEYGRILTGYLEHFAGDQLLCLSTKQLEDDPASVLRATYAHLGVDEIMPPTLGQRFHVGGGNDVVSRIRSAGQRVPGATTVWHVVPQRHRARLANRARGLARPSRSRGAPVAEAEVLDPAVAASLADHFRADAEHLARTTGFEADWPTTTTGGAS